MSSRPTALLLLLLAIGAGGGAVSAAAAPPEGARTLLVDTAVSLDQAVRIVEQRFHARVLKAEAQSDNGRTVYVLRLLDDSGKVWTVRVDAASGALQ